MQVNVVAENKIVHGLYDLYLCMILPNFFTCHHRSISSSAKSSMVVKPHPKGVFFSLKVIHYAQRAKSYRGPRNSVGSWSDTLDTTKIIKLGGEDGPGVIEQDFLNQLLQSKSQREFLEKLSSTHSDIKSWSQLQCSVHEFAMWPQSKQIQHLIGEAYGHLIWDEEKQHQHPHNGRSIFISQ